MGFEPTTFCLEGRRSTKLSYHRVKSILTVLRPSCSMTFCPVPAEVGNTPFLNLNVWPARPRSMDDWHSTNNSQFAPLCVLVGLLEPAHIQCVARNHCQL
jgi:hypothetical protein